MKGGRSTKHVKMDIPVLSESCSTLIHCQVEHTIFMTTKEARTYLDQARKFVLRLKFLFVGSIILVASLNSAMSSFRNKSAAVMLMTFFFAVTTPFGIALGIGISAPYNENSPTALIVEGVFNAASSGILIYMALVDLLAADFINPSWMKQNGTLQL